ncbi:MAG: hypothetical protein K8R87_07405 [Verrucomicrobia bacterium]|nr:hypothetical protein [Verrucomicrobiota bacterium]
MADETLSDEGLEAQLEGRLNATPMDDAAAQQAATAAVQTQAVEAAATKTPEQITAEAEAARVAELEAQQTEEGQHAPKRIVVSSLAEPERLKMMSATNLARAEGISFADAWDRINPKTEASQQQQQEQAPVDPIAALETELAEVQERRNQAAEDRALTSPELLKDERRERELYDEIRNAKAAKEQQAQAALQSEDQKFNAEWDASADLVAKTYDAKDIAPDSELTKAVNAEIEAMDKNHRDFGRADLPVLLYTKHAALLGIAPVKKGAPASQQATRPGMLPASGATKTQQNAQFNSAQTDVAFTEKLAKAVDSGSDLDAYLAIEERASGGKQTRDSLFAR